jgi:CRISPR-associated Csx14 family protein
MKIAGIAPIGFSPPVVTEFVQYVYECRGERMRDLVLIATSHEFVKAGVYLTIEALRQRYPRVRVHPIYLEFEDVDDEDKMYEFLRVSCNALVSEKIKYKSDIIHLCIAGGRKEESVLLTLLGQLVGVNTIMHFIVSDIRTFNIELERAKKKIEDILNAKDKKEYYEKYKEEFDRLMFPDISSYSAIEIPILPYPKSTLKKIIKILRSKGYLERDKVDLEYDVIQRLSLAGLIRAGSRRIYILDSGERFGEAIKALTKII